MTRAPARSFEDLVVWQKAHTWVLKVYRLTRSLPSDERYGLSAQLRRAAVSVPANIAEGFKKRGQNDKCRFINIAQGSAEECRYYLILIADLSYGDTAGLQQDLLEVCVLLESYAGSIRRDANRANNAP